MTNLTEERPLHPAASIGVFMATVFLGFMVIGPLVGFMVAIPFYDGTMMALVESLTKFETTEAVRVPFMIMQACASGVGLIVIPLLAYQFIVKEQPAKLLMSVDILAVAVTGIVVVLFMFPNSLVIEWNASLNFDGNFWTWAREREDIATEFTQFITQFQSSTDLIVGLLVIGVLPAIGEEFAFRGWLQPAIQKVSGNPHVAIWISAFLFSALHMQFFGFVPRMLLGALFGYLMYWSGNLWIPIVAHLVNNGFAVIMIYLHQTGAVEFDADSPEALPWTFVIPATIIFVGVFLFLKKQLESRGKVA
jgi:membrane protease YdiL (CAAX protease family)